MDTNFYNTHAGTDDEEFRDMPGYEKYYIVSSKGYVLSTRTDTIISPRLHHSGYYYVNISDDKIRKCIALHTIIAITFLEKPSSKCKLVIDHINGIKIDNRKENLRYCSYSVNTKNMHNKRKSTLNHRSKIICKLDKNGNVLERYPSFTHAAKANNIKNSFNILKCCKNPNKKYICKGFGWRYSKKNKFIKINLEKDEIFKPIYSKKYKLYFSRYEISNYGKIRKIENGIYLNRAINSGYYSICLYNDKRERKTMSIHRLVAFLFIKKPKHKNIVNHIDENKLNNDYKNLEWVTLTENSIHSLGKKILQIDINTKKIINSFDSIHTAAKAIDKPEGYSNISKCCRNKINSVYGYIWKFCD